VCWDNAAAESFFGALKNEMYYRQSFPGRARARFAVADYIEVFYNRRRLHSSLGYRTPLKHSHSSRPQQPLHDQQPENCPRSLNSSTWPYCAVAGGRVANNRPDWPTHCDAAQLRPAGVSELGSVRTTGWRDDRLADDAGR
jgi:hypothetical protein